MRNGLYGELVKLARSGKTASYTEIGGLVGLHPRSSRLHALLSGVCTEEVGRGRPMLGAVVVGKSKGVPGGGFFHIAERLGRFRGGDKAAEKEFFSRELKAVYDAWQ